MVFSWFLQLFFGGQELETSEKSQEKPPKTMTNHQNHCKNQEKNPEKNTIFKLSLKIEFSWFFLVFTVVLVVKSSKPLKKTKKKHENSILRDSLKMVFFLGFFLGFYSGFGDLFMVLVVFLGFLQWLRVLDHQKTTVKTKKNHENSILRDSLKMVFFFWVFFLVFYSGFGGLFMVFGGFSRLFQRFRALDHQKTTVKNKKKHENSILRDSLKIVVFFWFFSLCL